MSVLTNSPALALVRRELLSSMRRARTYAFLTLFVAGAIALIVAGWPEGPNAFAQAAVFSRMFVGQMTAILSAICFLLVPAFAATSVISEREQDTLDLLRLTLVRPGGIILAKLTNCVGFFVFLIVASLPVFGVTFFLVGIDWPAVSQGALMLLMTAIICGALGIVVSTRSRSAFSAIVRSYACIFLMFVVLNIVFVFLLGTSVRGLSMGGSYGAYSAIEAVFAAALCLWAARSLRRMGEPAKVESRKPIDDPAMLRRRRRRFPFYLIDPLKRKKPIEDWRNPMSAKETRWGLASRGTILARTFCGALILLFFTAAGAIATSSTLPLIFGQMALALVLAPGLLANSFTKERELGNLDMLRLTLLRPRQIVVGKLVSGAVSVSPIVLAGTFWIAITIWFARGSEWQLLLTGYGTLFVSIWLSLSLSVLASLLARRTTTAVVLSYSFSLVAFFGLSWLARVLVAATGWPPRPGTKISFFFSPVLAFGERAARRGATPLTEYWLANVTVFAAISFCLTVAAVRVFNRRHLRDK